MRQSRIDNPETLATLCTHDKQNPTQHRRLKYEKHGLHRGEPILTLCHSFLY